MNNLVEQLNKSNITRSEYINAEMKKEINKVMKNGGKVVDTYNANGKLIEKGKPSGLAYKTARQIARKNVLKRLGYQIGSIGKSKFAGMASRKERRQQAKLNGEKFVPVYND